jgi:hypothetical protein
MGPLTGKRPLFASTRALTELTSAFEAKRKPMKWLQALAKKVATEQLPSR